jgi:hypothetical protein
MTTPPDVWYFLDGASPSRSQLRWQLAEDDWSVEFGEFTECVTPHLYFVDVAPYQASATHRDSDLDIAKAGDPSGSFNDTPSAAKPGHDQIHYIVALLHYAKDRKDFDEPVPIRMSRCSFYGHNLSIMFSLGYSLRRSNMWDSEAPFGAPTSYFSVTSLPCTGHDETMPACSARR